MCATGALKERAHFCQNAQVSFQMLPPFWCLSCTPSSAFSFHGTPGFESSVCLALELWNWWTTDRRSLQPAWRLEQVPEPVLQGRAAPWRSTQFLAACISYMGMFVLVPESKEKAVMSDSNFLKSERTPICEQMMVFCLYIRIWNLKTEFMRWH